MNAWRKISRAVLELVYPRGVSCLGCGDPLHADRRTGLCEKCMQRLEKLKITDACPRCMTKLDANGRCGFCRGKPIRYLRACYGAYTYTGLARKLIWRLKFHWEDEPAQVLADNMLPLPPRGEYDALVPVPLHERRQRRRGANQAETLCRLLAPRLGMPVLPLLKRTGDTLSQVKLSAAMRRKNVRNAFEATGSAEGLRILLVDDIRTTGATAQECARMLLKCGAKYVGLLTAAIAMKK